MASPSFSEAHLFITRPLTKASQHCCGSIPQQGQAVCSKKRIFLSQQLHPWKGSVIQSNHGFIHDWMLHFVFKPRCTVRMKGLRRCNGKQQGKGQGLRHMGQGRSVLVPQQNRTHWLLTSASLQPLSTKRRVDHLLQGPFIVSQWFTIMAKVFITGWDSATTWKLCHGSVAKFYRPVTNIRLWDDYPWALS